MANFNTAFGLCSTTDSKGLLGVSEDDEGRVVVTLGKSMIICCRLSDQKQLNSWSTALAKLTSKVVWDGNDQNYVGVFDNIYIKRWKKSDSSLEKTKKHKFKNEIEKILIFSKDKLLEKPKLIVLFKNGSIRDLESALSNSKETMNEVIMPQETIELADIILDGSSKYLIIVSKFENKYRQCYCIELQENEFLVGDSIKKIKVRRQGTSLLGFTTLNEEKGNSLLTFWSDGFLYSLPLPLKSEKSGVGKYLGAINFVSKTSEVAIRSVSQHHVAIYGSDVSEEGSFLAIYNVKFGVVQAQTSFKIFNKPPRMWSIDNKLVILVGQRLVCVPFNLQMESLSTLVGSRALHADTKTPPEISTIVPTAIWDADGASDSKNRHEVRYPDKIKEQLMALSSEGWSEFGICQALMTRLIEDEDVDTLLWCLNNFSDIPEDHLVRMLRLALKEAEKEGFPAETELKRKFLKKILTVPVDNFNLLINLKKLLDFDDCLALINYLCSLFSQSENGDVSVEESTAVLEWTMTLLDAFYQYFILSKDPEILKSITLMKGEIEDLVIVSKDMTNVIPYLMEMKKGKVTVKKRHGGSYSVEKIQLYS